MGAKPPRTPWTRILPNVVRLFLKPAMFGWTLRAFCVVVMAMTPLAAVSAFAATPPEGRFRLAAVAGLVEGSALALYCLAKRIRAR